LCRQDPQGRQAGGSADRTADEVRAGHQSHNRESAGPDDPADTPTPGGSGDRVITRRAFSNGLAVALLGEPIAGSAQQVGRLHCIGILSSTDPARPNENYVTFRERLRELGWNEGQNLTIEERNIGPDRERLAVAARELVGLRLDLILAGGGAEA